MANFVEISLTYGNVMLPDDADILAIARVKAPWGWTDVLWYRTEQGGTLRSWPVTRLAGGGWCPSKENARFHGRLPAFTHEGSSAAEEYVFIGPPDVAG